jgi:CubicO group peptidase (beta-lactamase class C family)
MVLVGAEWHGKRIVSRAWLDASFKPVIDVNANLGVRYGRLWYLGKATTSALLGAHRWLAGFGDGGQRLYLMPDADFAVVMFFGGYNRSDQSIAPNHVWREVVLANLPTL